METFSSEEINDLLVAYALGALEPAEIEQVHRLLRERPELQSELDELRATVEQLPYGLSPSVPPVELRQQVLQYALGRNAEPAAALTRPRLQRRFWWPQLAFGLALALVLALGQLYRLNTELLGVRAELASVRNESRQLAQVIARPAAFAALTGDGGSATAFASADGALLLTASLPPLPDDQIYQLWSIAADGVPQSAGVFSIDADGYGRLTISAPPNGVTLAITAEPRPGSAGPTTPVLAAGTLS